MNSIKKENPFQQFDQVPPQSLEIEAAVLGTLLIEGRSFDRISNFLTPESFYKEEHRIIFETIRNLHRKNMQIDLITVADQLGKTNELDRIGGAYGLSLLTNRIATSGNLEDHAKILVQFQLQRNFIQFGMGCYRLGYSNETDIFESIDQAARDLQRLSEIAAGGGNMQHCAAIYLKSEEELIKRRKLAQEGKCTGIPTGLHDLDRLTGGWQNSELVVLAGRPGMGKTAMLLHFALIAARAGFPVCLYSLEMSDVKLMDRLILSLTDIDPNRWKSGRVTDEELTEFCDVKSQICDLPIYIDDRPIVTMQYITNHSRIMQRRNSCSLILIDYLQLADMRLDERNRNREQEVSQASRQAKIMAKSLDVPVILASQLSRAVESRADKIPVLSDLRESGAIEQDADLVLFVYRPEKYEREREDFDESYRGKGALILEKNRNGACGKAGFRYNPSMTQISEIRTQD